MYLLKLALRPWRMAPLSQVFSSLAVGFLLLLVGLLFWLEQGLGPVIHRLRSEQVVTAYLDPSLEAAKEQAVVDAIRLSLGASAIEKGRVETKLMGTQDFIQELEGEYPELGRELQNLGGEMNAIVPRYVTVTGILADSALTEIQKVPGIESAESSKDRYHHIVGAFSTLRWVARILAAGLVLALLTGLMHLSRMNSYLHQDALSLLRLWGASASILKVPGLLSGLWVGLAGGAIAGVGWLLGGSWLASHVRSLSPILQEMNVQGVLPGVSLLAAGALLGMLSGALGGTREA